MISYFDTDWKTQSPTIPYKEIDLFRLFAQLLSKHLPTVFSDETHGNVAQVEFSSSYFLGTNPHCEISDLLIIVFSKRAYEVRATFCQTKRRYRHLLNNSPHFSFTGDINQYDLLANRPVIKGLGSFKPNPHILSKAILPSIGSFGIFYRAKSHSHIELYYSTARNILPRSVSKNTVMYIPVSNNSYYYHNGKYQELISCNSMAIFAHNLIAMKIGSPIDLYSSSVQNG